MPLMTDAFGIGLQVLAAAVLECCWMTLFNLA